MPVRKIPLVEGHIYHIFTRSIGKYEVFKSEKDYLRMLDTIEYYRNCEVVRFSQFQNLKRGKPLPEIAKEGKVSIISYCLMPTHLHFILFQEEKEGISKFMERVLKSYAKYFNYKYRREGPLWSSRFKNVLVKTDEQLLHLTRYIHLNPCTSFLVEKPEEWKFSSYLEFIGESKRKICEFEKFLDINPPDYKKFVEERKDYQRELAKIKDLLLE
ncbi:transposase [bacterium]|nr:transposase [bacterium]